MQYIRFANGSVWLFPNGTFGGDRLKSWGGCSWYDFDDSPEFFYWGA